MYQFVVYGLLFVVAAALEQAHLFMHYVLLAALSS
jgi:hypothetical protein